jgi:hypothetical protein
MDKINWIELNSMWTKIFNALPIELKNAINVTVFKRKLKNYLLCNVFYSLKGFFNNWWHGSLVENLSAYFYVFSLEYLSLLIIAAIDCCK